MTKVISTLALKLDLNPRSQRSNVSESMPNMLTTPLWRPPHQCVNKQVLSDVEPLLKVPGSLISRFYMSLIYK